MKPSSNKCYLYYSRIASLPIIGSSLYILENWLLKNKLINSVFASKKKNYYRERLFKTVSQDFKLVVCKTLHFGNTLKLITAEVILDIDVDIAEISTKNLSLLMWTLIFTKSITRKTKNSLSNFIPRNFPILETVIIPYQDDLNLVCDYVFQTGKSLTQKDHDVFIIIYKSPIWFVKYFLLKILKKEKKSLLLNNKNSELIRPLYLLPESLCFLHKLRILNRKSILFWTNFFISRFTQPIVWCFDPEDADLVKKVKQKTTTLYDCIDYFTSLNPDEKTRIETKEKELIKLVDYFFVNSQILKRVKQSVRSNAVVVLQGFDLEGFTEKNMTKKEQEEANRVKKIFLRISSPRVGFVGNLTYRLDFKLLFNVIPILPQVTFVFTDAYLPIPADDMYMNTKENIYRLRQFSNVYFLPKTKNRHVIKEIIKNIDIGIIPYDTSLDFNRYSYPMKLFEYFYMGKPVISTPIEELRRFPKYVKIGQTATEWKKNITTLLENKWPESYKKAQKKLAEENSWEKKIDTIENILQDLEAHK